MSEQPTHCPVAHAGQSVGAGYPSRYNLIATAAQRHITEPGNHAAINADLRVQLEDHYGVMSQHLPEKAQQTVARGVRSANFAAFFHIAAEPLIQDAATEAMHDWPSYDFRHTKFMTEPAQQFVQQVASTTLKRYEDTRDAMLTPESPLDKYHELAVGLPTIVLNFNEAMVGADLHPSYRTELAKWFKQAAEDNTAAHLDLLISAGNACRSEQPKAQADDMAAFALTHLDTLSQAASVNGTASAKLSLRHEEPAAGFDFGRKDNVIAYETAVEEGGSVISTSAILHTSPKPNWGGPLKNGAWRQPGYCPSWPNLSSYIDPNIRFRTIAAELGAATTVAAETVYRQWPA